MANYQCSQNSQNDNENNANSWMRTEYYELLRDVTVADISEELLQRMKPEKLSKQYEQILQLRNKTDAYWNKIKNLTNFYSPFNIDIIKLTTRLDRMAMEVEMLMENNNFRFNINQNECQTIETNQFRNEETRVKQIETVTLQHFIFIGFFC